MEIDSRYVGAKSKVLTHVLSSRQTMNYAAALGDNNPRYFDDACDRGICAPPMLAVALTWPLSSDFGSFWGDSDFPLPVLMRQVHYNESISWTRLMRPDEPLHIQGEIVAMLPHPSGTLITLCYEATGQEGGGVFTEHISGLLRGVSLTDEGRESAAVPTSVPLPEVGGAGWTKACSVDPLAAHVYDGCTEIVFPIHTSKRFARQVGLPDPIYHGTATLGLAVRDILEREGGGDPANLTAVHCGFRGMVFPGTTITIAVVATMETTHERVVCFDVLNGQGVPAIRHGRVHFKKNFLRAGE